MKTSAVLASLLFGSYAAAAPVDKRALVYKTEIVTETVVVYTTVYEDEYPTATSSAGEFYEQQQPTTTSTPVVYPTSPLAPAPAPTSTTAPAYTAVVPEPSSSSSTPPAVESSTPIYTPTPAYTPAPTYTPEPEPETPSPPPPPPAPTTTQVAYTPQAPAPVASEAPATSPAAPAPKAPSDSGSSGSTGGVAGGQSFSDVDITVYDNTGAPGACGVDLTDDMMVVAIAQDAWNAKGGSTYDVMTGESSNPWCGTQIEINYNGATTKAKILDLCPGCSGHDIDLSHAAWKSLGLTELTRLKASWSIV